MTQYPVPFDIKFEDKIFGGKYSMYQVYCLIPAGIWIFLISPISSTMVNNQKVMDPSRVVVCVIIEIIFALIGLTFAFIKVNELNLFQYYFKRTKFKYRKRNIKFYE